MEKCCDYILSRAPVIIGPMEDDSVIDDAAVIGTSCSRSDDDDDDNMPDLFERNSDYDDEEDDSDDDDSDDDDGDSDDDDDDDDDEDRSASSTEDDGAQLLPLFDIKAHKAGRRDLSDLAFLSRLSDVQKERWQHERLAWDRHLELVFHEETFNNEYRMSYDAFNKLKEILQPILQRNANYCRDADPILTEHVMAMGIRYLKGGTVLDNRRYLNMSRAAAYSAIDDFIDAVNTAPELDICFPTSPEEWNRVREGWQSRSSLPQIYHGCVGALDGKFAPTTKPMERETGNIIAYYSGHYESYGLNCQALVRDDLQYMYFGVVSPGATNDNVSYPRAVELKKVIDSLPLGLYIVGDAAYTLSEKILVPYTGQDRQDPFHDSFNYHLSQLRIRVEMAFGYMVNKFRILSRKLECSMEKNSAILMACARLHNFIIKHDKPFAKSKWIASDDSDGEEDLLEIVPHPSAPLGMSYMPQLPDDTFDTYQGVSFTRQTIVDQLRERNVRRPLYNIQRKIDEMNFKTKSGHVIDREFISPI